MFVLALKFIWWSKQQWLNEISIQRFQASKQKGRILRTQIRITNINGRCWYNNNQIKPNGFFKSGFSANCIFIVLFWFFYRSHTKTNKLYRWWWFNTDSNEIIKNIPEPIEGEKYWMSENETKKERKTWAICSYINLVKGKWQYCLIAIVNVWEEKRSVSEHIRRK